MAIVTPHDPKATTVISGENVLQGTSPQRQGLTSVEAPSTQVVEEVKSPSPAEDPALSSKFAILAKREKAIRAKQREIEERERTYKSQEDQYKSALSLKDRLAQDPINTLSELGISYNQLTDLIINSKPEDQALRELKREIQSIKETQTKAQSEYEAKQAQSYEQALTQIRTDVTLMVESDPITYEAIHKRGAKESVVSLIEETFKETGRVLSNEEAAAQVEEFLRKDAEKATEFSFIKAKLAPPTPDPVEAAAEQRLKSQQTRTLSNATMAQTTKPMSDRDRRLRAIAAFKGQLS